MGQRDGFDQHTGLKTQVGATVYKPRGKKYTVTTWKSPKKTVHSINREEKKYYEWCVHKWEGVMFIWVNVTGLTNILG